MDRYVMIILSRHYRYRCMLCVWEKASVRVCNISVCVCVCVCGGAGGQAWWSSVSWWLCEASQPWRGCHNYQLSSVREMTHSLFNKTCHPDRRTDTEHDGQWDRRRKDKRHKLVNILTLHRIWELDRLALNSWKQEKAVGVIGLQQHGSGVNGLIWGLTPFKTNLRLCVIVPLTKFLTWTVQRFPVLLEETCRPAKGHLMVFQTHSITLMYRGSKY